MKITAKGIVGKISEYTVSGTVDQKEVTANIEGFTISESLPVDFTKSFLDEADSQENLAFLASKPILSNNYLTDQKLVTFTKGLVTQEQTQSVFSRVVSYVRFFGFPEQHGTAAEAASTSEVFVPQLTKGFLDTPITESVLTFNLSTVFGESLGRIEKFELNFSSNKDELITTSESISNLIFKPFSETLTATDDFLGEANIDDDQYAIVGKVFASNTSFLYELNFNAGHFESSSANTVEEVSLASAKEFLDVFSLQALITLHSTKALSSESSTTETILKYKSDYFAEDYSKEGYAGTLV
jgi:hypothetical protein